MMRQHAPSVSQITQTVDFSHASCFDSGSRREGMTSFPREDPKGNASAMTVGIAVLCEKARSAVVIADRLVEVGNRGIDTDCVKLTNPAPGILAVFSGFKHHEALAIQKLGDLSRLKPQLLASKLRLACAKIVERDADARIRAYGLRMDSLREQNLAPSAVNVIVNHVAEARLKGGFLLAANDANQVCLCVVNDQNAFCCNDPGYSAIGSGSTLALPILAAKRVHRAIDLEEALYAAYEAKRISEEVGSVGRQSDMAIAEVGKPAKFLSEAVLDELEAIYQRRLNLSKYDKNAIRKLIES